MFETTAGVFVTQMRTQLGASPTWQAIVGAANASGRVHFPVISLSAVNGPADPLPACLITRQHAGRRKWIEGASGLVSGQFELLFYFPAIAAVGVSAAYGVGTIEDTVDAIVGEIIAQRSGIPFHDDATIDPATDPTDAAIATTVNGQTCAYRTCRATLSYGYTA